MTQILYVGCGLATGLSALALKRKRPEIEITVVESRQSITRDKTWSFHESDVPSWVMDLVDVQWSHHRVRFFSKEKTVESSYCSVFPDSLYERVKQEANVKLGQPVTNIDERSVTLASGEVLRADVVVDSRPQTLKLSAQVGYQKFLGLEVELKSQHLNEPILMDTCELQEDGFEFIYVLPFDGKTALVEWTAYSNSPGIPRENSLRKIYDYIEKKLGCPLAELKVVREEQGSLPIPLNCESVVPFQSVVPRIGYGAGFFHFTTGYSASVAAIVADTLASLSEFSSHTVCDALNDLQIKLSSQRNFEALLNRMMFEAAHPEKRWKIFSRFYKLNPKLIERFYAGKLSKIDKLRILTGRPPVPFFPAIRAALSIRSHAWDM